MSAAERLLARTPPDREALLRIGRELLVALGEDPEEARVADTPRRFADLWVEMLSPDTTRLSTCFSEERSDDCMVVVSGMRVWSLCEHHLVPFWCDISVGYLPGRQVLGLSKFARIAKAAAARLQLQERLVSDIADAVQVATDGADVAVMARGEHLCMTMRGARTPALTTTSVMRGRFREAAVRAEFLALVAQSRR